MLCRAGQNCTDNHPTGNDNGPDKQTRQTAADLYNLLLNFDVNHPEEIELVISKITSTKTWPRLLQPMPSLTHRLAISYHYKHNRYQELRYLLRVCCVYDPFLYANSTHPTRVNNLYRLVCLFQSIAFAKKSNGTLPKIPFERWEIGLVYKYNMLKVADAAPVSHGRQSTLARAVRVKLLDEARLIKPDGEVILALMKSHETQASMRQLQSKIIEWAGIVEEEALYR